MYQDPMDENGNPQVALISQLQSVRHGGPFSHSYHHRSNEDLKTVDYPEYKQAAPPFQTFHMPDEAQCPPYRPLSSFAGPGAALDILVAAIEHSSPLKPLPESPKPLLDISKPLQESPKDQQLEPGETKTKKSFRRWTDEEDDALRNLFERYGRQWKLIASEIPGRVPSSCNHRWDMLNGAAGKKRPSAEKPVDTHLTSLPVKRQKKAVPPSPEVSLDESEDHQAEDESNAAGSKRRRWTVAEDNTLQKLVECHGTKWKTVAAKIPHRSANQCMSRWRILNSTPQKSRVLKSTPSKTGRPWTSAEDTLLRKLVKIVGRKDWKKISSSFSNRSGQQCASRWQRISKPNDEDTKRRRLWTVDDDNTLRAAVEAEKALGDNIQWTKIAASFADGRSSKQCRERWWNHLQPNLVKSIEWTEENDRILLHAYMRLGGSWAFISTLIPGSAANSIKNHFYGSVQKLVISYLAEKQKVAISNVRRTASGHLDFMGDLDGVLAAARGVERSEITPSDLKSLDANLAAFQAQKP